METMYSQIITKLIEMNYFHFVNGFVNGEELLNAVNLIVNIYDLKKIINEKFDDDTFKKMINSAVKNLTHVLIGSFGYDRKEKQFTEWFNKTYMDQ